MNGMFLMPYQKVDIEIQKLNSRKRQSLLRLLFHAQIEVIISVKDNKRWYLCPYCRKKILKYDETDGKSKKIYIKCRYCKKEVEINIE